MKDFLNSILYGNIILSIIRLFLGLLFIYSGIFKVIDLENFSRIMFRYDIAPEILVPYGTIFFSFLELILGVLLLTGYKIKAASLVSMVLMLFFIIIISINIYRENSFDCGCFELNRFGIKEEIGYSVIIRDAIFLLLSFLVLRAKKQILSIENFLDKQNLKHLNNI
jgi:putative oxidoreductase